MWLTATGAYDAFLQRHSLVAHLWVLVCGIFALAWLAGAMIYLISGHPVRALLGLLSAGAGLANIALVLTSRGRRAKRSQANDA